MASNHFHFQEGGIAMDWQMIFQLSKVNGALYLGEALPAQNWKWPKNTWLQERLRDLRREDQNFDQRMGGRNLGNGFSAEMA